MENQLDTVRIADLPSRCNSRSANPSRSEIFLRKTVAACKLVAEKKIDYALLDNTVGFPGHLGELKGPKGMEDLATKIGGRLGSRAEAYWRERYASRKTVERLIAELRDYGLIGVVKRHRKPGLYRLLHPDGYGVLGCSREWLNDYFAGDRSGLEMLVLMDLRSHAGAQGIFPSQRTIANDIGVSEASAHRALRSLKRRGEITAALRPGRRHNCYIITLSAATKKGSDSAEYLSRFQDRSSAVFPEPSGLAKGSPDESLDGGDRPGRTEREGKESETSRVEMAPSAAAFGTVRATGVTTTGLTPLNPVKTTALRPYNQILKENQIQMRALPKTRGIGAFPNQPAARSSGLGQTPVSQKNCSAEEFESLRQAVFRFVMTDRSGNPTPPPEWVEGPPDDTITCKIAAAGGWNIPVVVSCLRSLKKQGKKPEESYVYFERLVEARVGRQEQLRRQSERASAAQPVRNPQGVEGGLEFSQERLRRFIDGSVAVIRRRGFPELLPIADALDGIVAEIPMRLIDLEALERELTRLEQSLIEIARSGLSETEALAVHSDVESELRPFRSRMNASQIATLETQYSDRAVLKSARLPRLSLFYLR